MILGIGVDITQIDRMQKILESRHRRRFLERLLCSDEIDEVMASATPAEKLAGIFAAKEAVAKALGLGFSSEVYPSRIRIHKSPEGVPQVSFSSELDDFIKRKDVGNVSLSISHTKLQACAFVVIEKTRS